MKRFRARYLTAILLTALAAVSLLLTYRTQPLSAPEQVRLSPEYFFQAAEMTVTGDDGRAALAITARTARRALEGSVMTLDDVVIRRGDPQAWSLEADSARIPDEGANISADGNIRLNFGPRGAWTAQAERAQLEGTGASLTLNGGAAIRNSDGRGGGSSIASEQIVLDLDRMTAQTDLPVQLRVGELVFEANGLSAQLGEHVVTLDSDVQSTIRP